MNNNQKIVQFLIYIISEWNLSPFEMAEIIGESSIVPDTQLSEQSFQKAISVINIYKYLGILFQDAKHSNSWVHKENQSFNGQTAFNVMKTDINQVERYLAYYACSGPGT